MDTLCTSCGLKRDTWAESLKKDGYNGCILLVAHENIDLETVDIEAETLATGWIKIDSQRCLNNQLITKFVSKCQYYQEK